MQPPRSSAAQYCRKQPRDANRIDQSTSYRDQYPPRTSGYDPKPPDEFIIFHGYFLISKLSVTGVWH